MYTQPTRATTADQATAAIFDAIMDGSVEPGTPLRLQEIASELGMSMMPVRDALRRLETLGLVEIVPYKGARLRELSAEDLVDTYATRIELEAVAVRWAAPRFGPDDAERARAALDDQAQARAAGDRIAARNAHERFHFALYEACGSGWLVRSILPAWRNSERYRVKLTRPEHAKRRAAEHREILAALEAHDAVAAVTHLVNHLRTSVALVLTSLPDAKDVVLDLPGPEDVVPRALAAPAADDD